MLDSVRSAGRWVSRRLLDRLSERSSGPEPPARSALVREFCRATRWVNPRSEPCLASAARALQRLEQQGLVRLPPAAGRPPRSQPRQLRDDGLPLPELPRLSRSAEGIGPLRLQLLRGCEDPDHGLWNRLMIREHPLGAAPLFGAQLRYLIHSDAGLIGGFGFGPAAFHLDCRDGWIGWDAPARNAHRQQVLGLSRFLIRPGLRCANLASCCYGRILARVAQDWEERYGWRPVLVETYVDRATHTGRSLAAANWRRLGQSLGRGRSSPAPEVRPKTPKDVWVYELTPKAREILRQQVRPPVPPRSLFHGLDPTRWTREELEGLELGEARWERRFEGLLAGRWQHPTRSLATSFPDAATTKAAYRFLESPRAGLSFQSLLQPHCHQTHRRMAAESVVLLAQDTTTLSYNTLRQTRGLGPIGDSRSPGRGLLLHTLQAFRLDRIPLGCAWAQVWARAAESDTAHRNEQSVTDKESGRWIEAYQAAIPLAQALPACQLVVCGDRESDLFELFDQAPVAPPNLHLLVRAQHDRLLASGRKLWAELDTHSAAGTMTVAVPRRPQKPARTATLHLSWGVVEVSPPRVALKKSWSPVPIYAVRAREVSPPPGVEPIEWVLLTTWKVDSLKMARRLVRWYALRWQIECWHQVLKELCGVERRQLKSAAALERSLVLDMIIAWRALLLNRLGRAHPDLAATLYYTAEELAVLEVYKKKLPQRLTAPAANSTPTVASGPALSLASANWLVAHLAGFWGRKGDGHPGPKTLGRGLDILAQLVGFRRLCTPAPPPARRSRKPG